MYCACKRTLYNIGDFYANLLAPRSKDSLRLRRQLVHGDNHL